MQDAEYVPDGLTERQRGKRAKEGNGLMMMGGGGIAPATANANAPGGEAAPPLGGAPSASVAAQNINITYHFPVARIKRIMQADDDVGKVAQVTPVVVCMFLLPNFFFKDSLAFFSIWDFWILGRDNGGKEKLCVLTRG